MTITKHPQPPKGHGKKSRICQVSVQGSDPSCSDDEYLYTLGQAALSAKTPTVPVQVSGVTYDMIVDTAKSIDIVDEAAFNKINRSNEVQL